MYKERVSGLIVGKMKETKKKALRFFVGAEIVVVTFLYLCGNSGVRALQAADAQNNQLLEEVKQLEMETTSLARELAERQTNPFYKESIARKELQMAYPDETVYLLSQG